MTTETLNSTKNYSYQFGFIDEYAKKEIRRSLLKAVAIPGYQVPYASREMPMARGFGTGGLQITLSLVGVGDTLKVIDQGSDDSVNAVNIRKFVAQTCPGVNLTKKTVEADIIQTRHRIPEIPLKKRTNFGVTSALSRSFNCGGSKRGKTENYARGKRLRPFVGQTLRRYG